MGYPSISLQDAKKDISKKTLASAFAAAKVLIFIQLQPSAST